MTVAVNYSKYNNLSNKELVSKLNELLNADGDVFAWKLTFNEPPLAKVFASIQDAKEYKEIKNELLRRRGASFSGQYETVAYIIGDEKKYQKAVATFEAQKRKHEVSEYNKHIDLLVAVSYRDIQALQGLKDVCRTFDGKVINVRFHRSVREKTGYNISFQAGYVEMSYYNYKERWNESYVRMNAVYLGTLTYSGEKKVAEEDDWLWQTGDRMEAEKAALVIDSKINYLVYRIEELQATKKSMLSICEKRERWRSSSRS